MEYKRLTNNNLDEYNPEYDFCVGCEHFGEPNGCNRSNGTCGNYERFMETYNRLAELEDKIEQGTLIELPCKVGDTVYVVYATEVEPWEVTSIVIYDNDILLRLGHKETDDYNAVWLKEKGERLFFNPEEAEKKLKELQE